MEVAATRMVVGMHQTVDLSIVMPVFKEGGAVEPVPRAMTASGSGPHCDWCGQKSRQPYRDGVRRHLVVMAPVMSV